MPTSLSNFVNNLVERVHKIKCRYGHDDKKCEIYIIKIKIMTAFLITQTLITI